MARNLVRFSYQELQSEIRRRQRSVGALESRRNKLIKKLEHIDSLIRETGGTVNGAVRGGAVRGGAVGGGGGRRARNEMTLTGALEKVLANKTMSVVDASEAVQKIGYRTNSNSFRTQVNIALIKSGKFKRVGRGQYTVK